MHPAGKEATPPVMLTFSLIQFKQAIIMKLSLIMKRSDEYA